MLAFNFFLPILKIFLKIFFTFYIVFSCIQEIFGASSLVQDIFSDIDESYPYLQELQALYDRGMIIPDKSGKFNPEGFLNRDEFVGITMEVICKKCAQPGTDISFFQQFANSQAYFDVPKTNPYFYCIEEADDKNYIQGYDIGNTCEDGSKKLDERPFCPDNRIKLEEAVAVLLRNSGIFTIDDNQKIISDIQSGIITENISSNIFPTDPAGNPYTFYGYLQKALSYSITEYDTVGNPQILKLIEKDINGNIFPQSNISRETFLRMAYIIFQSNNCSDISENEIALGIDILDKSCVSGSKNCKSSQLDDPEDIYDFSSKIEGFCEEGIDDANGYFWRFYNTSTGVEFFKSGPYQDNVEFLSDGIWKIYLRVTDRCGKSSQVYSEIVVGDSSLPPQSDKKIDTSIIIHDGGCTGITENCEAIDFYEEGKLGDTFDLEAKVSTSCSIGNITYNWTFTSPSNLETIFKTGYIDNFEFLSPGEWLIALDTTDGCGNTGKEQETFFIGDSSLPPENTLLKNKGLSVSIQADPISGYTDSQVNFDAVVEGGNGNYTYDWNFGDGNINAGKKAQTSFVQEGIYEVLLRISDSDGRTGEAVIIIKVVDNNRCEQDSDGDGVFDCNDLCSDISGVEENRGCPLIEKKCGTDSSCPQGYSCSIKGSTVGNTGVCLPIQVSRSCLYTPSVGAIFGNSVCNSCPCDIQVDFLADIRKCDLVFPAITSPDGSNIYSRGQSVQVPY